MLINVHHAVVPLTDPLSDAEPLAWKPSRVTVTAPAWTSCGVLVLVVGCMGKGRNIPPA